MRSAKTNPLLASWTTPHEMPPFDTIEPRHFLPAFEVAMTKHMAEIDRIAGNPKPPTFANTIDALEKAGLVLKKVGAVFGNLAGAHTNPELQAIEREMAPRFAAHSSAIATNKALFARVDALYEKRKNLKLSQEQDRVLERTYKGFVRSGAKLEGAEKERMSEIQKRLATLGTQFGQNVLADESGFAMPLSNEDDLAGLPDFVRDTARSAARERKADTDYVVTLSRSLIEPFLTFSSRRDLREKAFKAWISRGANGGQSDNRAIIAETVKLRHERAQLLGYETFADYKLEDSMAKTPEAVDDLLRTVWQPARQRAEQEAEKLAALAAKDGINGPLEPWDWRYYAERVRQAEYELDEAAIKPYLPLDRMLEAAFFTATRLFGLEFTERRDLALYHGDVRAFEVTDAQGQEVGLFLADYFARPSKRSGAWMSGFRGQKKLGGSKRPIIVNVANFAKGADEAPSLLSFDDARTLFHEFGHALHGLLSDVTYPSLAGTSVSRDFVELPSQLYEHWLATTPILERFARHYKTGEPMPAALIEKIQAARTFNQGFATVEFLASALVDMALHDGAAAGRDPMQVQAETLASIGMPRSIVMRHASPHFAHVFSGEGYASGYYSYLWSEVLDADAFAAFEETGDIFDADTAAKLKQYIYAAGGSRKEADAYEAFRGKLPSVDGLLKKRGLIEA